MDSFFNYPPGSPEYNKLFSEAYQNYVSSIPSVVENTRLRPPDKDIFEWLMEDEESRILTNEMFEKEGIKW
jgi:hypothetical protein